MTNQGHYLKTLIVLNARYGALSKVFRMHTHYPCCKP